MSRLTEQLRVFWSRREKDHVFFHPLGPSTSSDAWLLWDVLTQPRPVGGFRAMQAKLPEHDPSLLEEELRKRGYDPTTLRVSIAKDLSHPRWQKEEPRG